MDSRREAVSRDISHWRDNENFLQWIVTINHISYEQAKELTAERFLGGWCEDFALYFAVRFGVPMLFLNQEHSIVNIAGLFFDAADCAGVERLSDMKYVRESPKLSRLSEEQLEKLLEVDEEWRKYKPLASRVGMIEKYEH